MPTIDETTDRNLGRVLLDHARRHLNELERGRASSNQICYFDYEGSRYVLKKPLMTGEAMSPFWRMMRDVFGWSVQQQAASLGRVYGALRENPHIPPAELVAATDDAMIFRFARGQAREGDAFPDGKDNAYRLGRYVGCNHRVPHAHCGLLGVEDAGDFTEAALASMDRSLSRHWNNGSALDGKLQALYAELWEMRFRSSRYSLIMADMSADQFLYDGDEIGVCVDLDAYVVGPVEWELSFLHRQVRDWDSFRRGYEEYQPMPPFRESEKFFFLLMALNAYRDRREMEECWSADLFD